MKRTKEELANELIKLFPEKSPSLQQHYDDYGELLGHIFFSEEITVPLFSLLQEHEAGETIRKYCDFIENMWENGTDYVVNVFDVTIAERLSDDETFWKNFGKNISDSFILYINNDLIPNNLMMTNVNKLELNG